jgi:hypothetical protein
MNFLSMKFYPPSVTSRCLGPITLPYITAISELSGNASDSYSGGECCKSRRNTQCHEGNRSYLQSLHDNNNLY